MHSIVGQTYVINVDSNASRWSHCLAEFYRHGIRSFARISAVEPRSKEDIPERLHYYWDSKPCSSERERLGTFGCTLSHLKAVEAGLEAGHEWIAVLEDDFVLADGFKDHLARVLGTSGENIPEDADVIMLGAGTFYQGHPIRVENAQKTTAEARLAKIPPDLTMCGCYAMLLRRSAMQVLKEKLEGPPESIYIEIDTGFVQRLFQATGRAYIVCPVLAKVIAMDYSDRRGTDAYSVAHVLPINNNDATFHSAKGK